MTKLLDIFNAAMSHPRDSAERDAGLRELGEAIRAQARAKRVVFTERIEFLPGCVHYGRVDFAKRAAGDTDED